MVVANGSEKKMFAMDQTQQLPSGEHFRLVGEVDLENVSETIITISNHDTVGYVIVDALQLRRKD